MNDNGQRFMEAFAVLINNLKRTIDINWSEHLERHLPTCNVQNDRITYIYCTAQSGRLYCVHTVGALSICILHVLIPLMLFVTVTY